MNQQARTSSSTPSSPGSSRSAPDSRIGRPTREPDIQRIASAVFCSIEIDPSIVAFAVRRAAVHWGEPEDEIDVAVSAALLASAARVMHELRPSDAR